MEVGVTGGGGGGSDSDSDSNSNSGNSGGSKVVLPQPYKLGRLLRASGTTRTEPSFWSAIRASERILAGGWARKGE